MKCLFQNKFHITITRESSIDDIELLYEKYKYMSKVDDEETKADEFAEDV